MPWVQYTSVCVCASLRLPGSNGVDNDLIGQMTMYVPKWLFFNKRVGPAIITRDEGRSLALPLSKVSSDWTSDVSAA